MVEQTLLCGVKLKSGAIAHIDFPEYIDLFEENGAEAVIAELAKEGQTCVSVELYEIDADDCDCDFAG